MTEQMTEQMMEWSELKMVLAVGRAGSLSAAARVLGVDKSTVLRQITGLEKKLGVRLFERMPQGYLVTAAGEAAVAAAERIEQQVLTLERELVGQDLRLQGNIRLTAPEGIAYHLLTPLLAEFCQRNPAIHIELITTNTALVLDRREADLAVRVTRTPPDRSLGRKIADFNFAIYGSRDYCRQHRALAPAAMQWVAIADEVDWLVPLIWKKKEQARLRLVLTCTSTLGAVQAIRQGMGVGLLPCFLGAAQQDLQRLGEPLPELASELWVLTHPDLRQTARVRALMTFIQQGLGQLAF